MNAGNFSGDSLLICFDLVCFLIGWIVPYGWSLLNSFIISNSQYMIVNVYLLWLKVTLGTSAELVGGVVSVI